MDEPTDGGRGRIDAYFSVSFQVAQRVARGEAAEAIAMLRRELARIAGEDEAEGRRFLYGMLAVCHGRSGDPEGVRAVLEEMERELDHSPATALKLAEGYLLLLGETERARTWARRAVEGLGESHDPSLLAERSRALSLEGRAALEAGDGDAALGALERAPLPDPDLAQGLLDAGAPPGAIREILAAGLARYREQETAGTAPTARSGALRRLLDRLEGSGSGNP